MSLPLLWGAPGGNARSSFAVFLLLSAAVAWDRGGVAAEESSSSSTDEEVLAAGWLAELEPKLTEVYSDVVGASWNYNVNLTEHNNRLQIEASLRRSRFEKDVFRNASRFDWRHFGDADLVRRFRAVTNIGCAALPDADVQQMNELKNRMELVYSTAEVCGRPPPTTTATTTTTATGNRTCASLNPDLMRIVATSRDWDEQLWAWKGWRDATGRRMKRDYAQLVELLNKGAKTNGYEDNGDYWRSRYEMADFAETCETLWLQVKPLYQQLHAYVRRKLIARYPENADEFPKTRHIPAHLTGNIWAQTWNNILNDVTPFPNSTVLDITSILKEKKFNVRGMFNAADSFFQSLGLHPMPPEFWNHSLLEDPKDGRRVVCHASAWDFYNGRDFRIKQCTDVSGEFFFVTHHEMGHVQYYLLYRHQPVVYRHGANPGFHEAIGDVMSLSVNTPGHLQRIGLLAETTDSYESDMNFFMKQALEKVAFLPFGYLVDRWRWEVFNGRVTPDDYNRYYWKLRCELQGISPPVERSEEDFDIGAKFHIIHNTAYIRYFVSYILQFQFHKSLCQTAGHNGSLHKCDIYQSKAVGDKLRRALELGSSKPWPDVLELLTGTRRMDAAPLLEYFEPLHDWLKRENEGHPVTWDDDCPPGAFASSAADPSSSSYHPSLLRLCLFVLVVTLACTRAPTD